MAKRTPKNLTPYQSIRALNLPEFSTSASIHIDMKGKLNSKSYGSGYNITIKSCDKQIVLHGRIGTPSERKNAVHKMDSLIHELSKAKEHLINECKKNQVKISK